MDAASLFGSANKLFVHEEFEEALKHYTCAVTLQDCSEHRSCRAAVYLKLGKYSDAVTDANEALKFDPKNHMAFHWRGIAMFYMGDWSGAKASFEESLRVAPAAKAPRGVWIRKCNAELSGSCLPLAGITNELTKVTISDTAPTSDAACAGMTAPSVVVSSEQVVVSLEQDTDRDIPVAKIATADPASNDISVSGRKPVRREWYQNSTHVIVTIFAKNVQQDLCKADFREKELTVSFLLPGSTDEEYKLDVDLFDAVEPAECKVEASKVKVEVTLQKKKPGFDWKDLEAQNTVALSTPDQPTYPTSSKQKRDWSQIEQDIDSQLKNEKPQGDEALNKLFKEIYDRADDETRRAMNKSFQTSGGTVLSTNWGEVAKSDYEGKDRPTAPEGQEWRNWQGQKK